MTVRTRSGDHATALVLKVMELHGEIHQHGRRLTEPVGESPARWLVLGAVRQSPLTVSQIARRMGGARQNVQRVANVLAGEGLIKSLDNVDHKRSPKFALTTRGRRVTQRITERQAVWANALGERVTQRSVKEAVKTLDKFLTVLRDLDEDVFR